MMPTRNSSTDPVATLRSAGRSSNKATDKGPGQARKIRRNKRRALDCGVRQFYYVDEAADITGTSERTIQRAIDDGELIATYIRGAVRIAHHDFISYLRKCRGFAALIKRRRCPRKMPAGNNDGGAGPNGFP